MRLMGQKHLFISLKWVIRDGLVMIYIVTYTH